MAVNHLTGDIERFIAQLEDDFGMIGPSPDWKYRFLVLKSLWWIMQRLGEQ